mgnify:CR=1 FL=1
MQYKVGQLVRYVEDGDVGIITSIEENGNYWVEFASGQTADCLCSELEAVSLVFWLKSLTNRCTDHSIQTRSTLTALSLQRISFGRFSLMDACEALPPM